MNKEKIKELLDKKEGVSIEFKKVKNKLPGNLFETICAFLNRSGGEIILGVNDDGAVLGVDEKVAKQLVKEISNLSNNPQKLFPSFLLQPHIVDFESKKLIYIFVPQSSQVHKTAGKVFDRSADGDFVLSTDAQLKQMYSRKSAEYSENRIYPFLYESDFAEGVVDRVRKIIRIYNPEHPWNELSDKEFYKSAGLYRKDLATGEEGFTLAALLLFGKPETIQSAIPHYKIDALLRKVNLDRYDDRINIRANLVEAYDILMSFVAKHLPDKFYLQGDHRISLRDKIFREVVANILIHREYTNAHPTTFIIYKDKVEAKNANKPHVWGLLKPGNFEPFPKNPHVAQIFTQMGRSEELGTGIRNVFRYNKMYSGIEENIFNEEDVFVTVVPLTFLNDKTVISDGGVNGGVSGGVSGGEEELYSEISKKEGLNAKQLQLRLNIPMRTIERWIKKLKQEKRIEFKGAAKTGGYYILQK